MRSLFLTVMLFTATGVAIGFALSSELTCEQHFPIAVAPAPR